MDSTKYSGLWIQLNTLVCGFILVVLLAITWRCRQLQLQDYFNSQRGQIESTFLFSYLEGAFYFSLILYFYQSYYVFFILFEEYFLFLLFPFSYFKIYSFNSSINLSQLLSNSFSIFEMDQGLLLISQSFYYLSIEVDLIELQLQYFLIELEMVYSYELFLVCQD